MLLWRFGSCHSSLVALGVSGNLPFLARYTQDVRRDVSACGETSYRRLLASERQLPAIRLGDSTPVEAKLSLHGANHCAGRRERGLSDASLKSVGSTGQCLEIIRS